MKKQTAISFAQISREQTNKLTTEVNETIAIDFVPFKTFTAIDLWNIQRKSKTIIRRRHLV